MTRSILLCSLIFLAMVSPSPAAEQASPRLTLTAPLDYQVFQRETSAQGKVLVAGQFDAASGGAAKLAAVEGRLVGKSAAGELPAAWQRVGLDATAGRFRAELSAPAGGWYRLEIRAMADGKPLAEAAVPHIGVGEVFIVAGQSNSSNHGAERQKPASGLVAAFDGGKWRLADDPQPGGSGSGGSFTPAFGDAMAQKFGVPIGMVNIGVGATSVREWLPRGERIANQPTTGGHVKAVGPSELEATGELFDRLASRLAALGPRGCRAILWHQGESDAGQARGGYPADRQITGEQYRAFMEKLIRASRAKAGWEIPWCTAQVTYHSEKDASDEEFRSAQAAMWKSGLAFQGPDTDALRAEYRDGVHFNAMGLRRHGELWAEKVTPWLQAQLMVAPAAAPAPAITDEAKVPPYSLPDPLICLDGTKVADAKTWREKRRPELLKLFETEVYGKTLVGRPADLKFVVREEKKDARGGKATRLRVGVLFEGREDGRQMELLIYLPNNAKGPVPMFLGFSFDGNYTTTDEVDIPLPKHWANGLFTNRLKDNIPTEGGRGIHKYQWQYDLALEHGFGVATAGYGEIEPDAKDRWKDGPRGLGPQPGADDWGCLGSWAWGMSRALDYLETNPRVDSKRVAVLGFSRLGKATMWAGAQDERFAMVISLESGAGGVALSKRIFGETIAHLTRNLGHWFCPNFRKYAGNEESLPIDHHELAALIAPRPLLINSATEDLWSDPRGEFLSGVAADPVYRLLGTDGISQKEWPEVGKLLTSRIGYFLRAGKHDVTLEDWQAMIGFAEKHFNSR